MDINILETIITKPEAVEKIIDWKAIEIDLKIKLPSDYKNFIELYGEGWIDDFILVLTPNSKEDSYNLLQAGEYLLANYASSKESFPSYYTHQPFDGENGLIPWGITENADSLYWDVKNRQFKSIVVYNARGGDFFEVSLSFMEFLIGVLSKKILCNAFPSDFPSENIEFIVE